MRIKSLSYTIILSLLLLLTMAAGCGSGDEGSTVADNNSATAQVVQGDIGSNKGDVAPDFTLKSLSGDNLTLSDLRGKAVLVDFWDTWCPPCRKALPHLQELSESYADDLVVVGVAFGREGEAAVRKYTQDHGLTFEMVLFEQTSTILTDFGGVQSIPTTFLIDAKGVIREKWVGAAEKRAYENAVVSAINGQAKAG